MIKRTIEISSAAAHLTVKQRQFLIQRDGVVVGQAPCEDIGMVVVDHAGTTYTHAALAGLVASDAALVICGRDHLPAGVLLPLSDHSQIVWRINDQISAGKPLQKRLWKQIVQQKIRNQAMVLGPDIPAHKKLNSLADEVRSGDPQNVEAQAAVVYWKNFLSDDERFYRNRESNGLNGLLNYGYSILRAAVARALVGSGLFPALGLHHRNRSNSFCLADDLMEPLRPLVDFVARDLYQQGYESLGPESKKELLQILTWPTEIKSVTGPLMVNLQRMSASLANCYRGESTQLLIPEFDIFNPDQTTHPMAHSATGN